MHYFVPSLNRKYPATYGQFYNHEMLGPNANFDEVIHIYSQNEVFVLDVLLSNDVYRAVSAVGIYADGMSTIDSYRVTEDY